MTEVIYHAMGFCGEHWHPNAINITAMALIASLVIKSIIRKHQIKIK
jgi:hypothetical protein